jgi:DNA-binding transcriptional MerR regulator
MRFYNPAQAAKLLQIASSSIRNYTRNPAFRPFFSATATPKAGTGRQLTAGDIKLLRFIADATSAGQTLQTVAQRLEAEELESFDWSPPGAEPEEEDPQQSRALVLASAVSVEFERYHAREDRMTAALFEAGRSIARAEARNVSQEERIADLQAQVERLEVMLSDREEVARLEAELADVRRPIGLLARLLGYRH